MCELVVNENNLIKTITHHACLYIRTQKYLFFVLQIILLLHVIFVNISKYCVLVYSLYNLNNNKYIYGLLISRIHYYKYIVHEYIFYGKIWEDETVQRTQPWNIFNLLSVSVLESFELIILCKHDLDKCKYWQLSCHFKPQTGV